MNSALPTFNPNYPGYPSAYRQVRSLPQLWSVIAQRFTNVTALYDPHSSPEVKLTYGQVYEQIQQFAAGLQSLGIKPELAADMPPRIALFADNQPRWMIADQGILRSGAINAVRGAQADPTELHFILRDSGAIAIVVQDLDLWAKLAPRLTDLPIQFVVLLSDEQPPDTAVKMLTFTQLLDRGKQHLAQLDSQETLPPIDLTPDTVATLMYTSGTGGQPKGVMLSHGNLLHQVNAAYTVLQLQPGERVLSILPIWHCYERTFEYFTASCGCTQIYTNIRFVKKDLKDHQPFYMVGVPRLWESIYEGIQKQFREQPAGKQKLVNFFLNQSQQYIQARRTLQNLDLTNLQPSPWQKANAAVQIAVLAPIHQLADRLVYRQVRAGLGNQLRYLVSGGGSISNHVEDFLEIVNIPVLGGYGLTETAPITHVRRPDRNLRGGDGQPLPETETRIVDPETRQERPIGQQGLVLIRGPQVMQGYYQNPTATAKAIDPEGWFDTGDLGLVTAMGDLVLTGRAKDTIVLSNGENIEPEAIEEACLRSPYIAQIMLVGQDQKILGALVVPNLEALQAWLGQQGDPDGELDLTQATVQNLFRQELTDRVKNRPGFRPDDRIGPFRLLAEPLTIENGFLTQTLKMRRNVVMEHYRGMIDEMF